MSFKFVAPRPNINGNTIDDLVEQHMDVKRAAYKLLEAMSEAMPHGRNYQTCDYPDERLNRARMEWRVAMKQVENIHDQAGAIAGDVFKEKRR